MAKIVFNISRRGQLWADGALVGTFATETAAADIAVRFAQDQGALYRLEYWGL